MHNTTTKLGCPDREAIEYQLSVDTPLLPRMFVPFGSEHLARYCSRSAMQVADNLLMLHRHRDRQQPLVRGRLSAHAFYPSCSTF